MPAEIVMAIAIEDEFGELASHEIESADDAGQGIAHLVHQLSCERHHAPLGSRSREREPEPERRLAIELLSSQQDGNTAPVRMAELRLVEIAARRSGERRGGKE
jgi:hypothetical protein